MLVDRKTKKIVRLVFLITLFFSSMIWSQENFTCDVDLLSHLTEEDLFEKFKKFNNDSSSYKKCANGFIKYARVKRNIVLESQGLYLMGVLSKEEEAIKYADSIILITKNLDNYTYPARAHLLKARNLGRKEEYAKALNELLEADTYATKNNNLDQKNEVKFFIGILKINLGDLEESLNYYKSANGYYESKYEENKSYQKKYLKSLFALGNGYTRVKKYDSAYYYMHKGMKLSIKVSDSTYYGYFLLSSGIINYFKKDYKASLDSLHKFNTLFKDRIKDGNEQISNMYIGKNYYEINDTEKSITFLKKVHSIPPFELRSCYEILLKIYKEQKNLEKQIESIDKIVHLDSIINKDFKYLYTKIEKKYSSPNLLREKEIIINNLKERTKTNRYAIYLLIVLLSFSGLLLLYNNNKRKVYKSRFLKLYNENTSLDRNRLKKSDDRKTKDIDIPSEVVKHILEKLEEFEKSKDFLVHNIKIAKLAEEFKTNSRYLSKLINVKKEKSFSNYINDLRINYTIEELKKNAKFRKYTIKAISHEVGFKSSEIFSKSFHKKTGIYPSFFLKELNSQEKTNN